MGIVVIVIVMVMVIVAVRMMSKFRNIMLLNSRKKEHVNKCEISNLITTNY